MRDLAFVIEVVKACLLGVMFSVGTAATTRADDTKLTLSATTALTTDYIFRGVSNSDQNPAAQPELDITYGIFYAGIWGSNTAFGDGIEIDYYAGITPKWNDITFTVGGLAYTFPGGSDINYFELQTGATWTGGKWTLGLTNYWSPNKFGLEADSDAIEGSVKYAVSHKLFSFFTPSISGVIGYQAYEDIVPDYIYWNAGLTLGFLEHWSADLRYWDTNYNNADCFINSSGFGNCDARVVGTLKAVF